MTIRLVGRLGAALCGSVIGLTIGSTDTPRTCQPNLWFHDGGLLLATPGYCTSDFRFEGNRIFIRGGRAPTRTVRLGEIEI